MNKSLERLDRLCFSSFIYGSCDSFSVNVFTAGKSDFRKANKRAKMAVKIVLLSIYLVTSHAAMVFGMLDPALGMTDTPK